MNLYTSSPDVYRRKPAKEEIKKVYWGISEVAHELHLPESTIRYWCRNFGIEPKRTRGNDRRFNSSERNKLMVINWLRHELGFTVKGAIKYIERNGYEVREI